MRKDTTQDRAKDACDSYDNADNSSNEFLLAIRGKLWEDNHGYTEKTCGMHCLD